MNLVGEKVLTDGFGVGRADRSMYYVEQNKENNLDRPTNREF